MVDYLDNKYLSTPSSGLIPYSPTKTGTSYVGTASWPFREGYIHNFNSNNVSVGEFGSWGGLYLYPGNDVETVDIIFLRPNSCQHETHLDTINDRFRIYRYDKNNNYFEPFCMNLTAGYSTFRSEVRIATDTTYPFTIQTPNDETSIRYLTNNGTTKYIVGTSTNGTGADSFGWYYSPGQRNNMYLTSNGDLHPYGRSYNAVYNDYAEFFPRGEETEVGDLIMLDPTSKEEQYILARKGKGKVLGVHSEDFGHIIGGDRIPDSEVSKYDSVLDYNKQKYIPVGLVGRCKVKILGPIHKNNAIVLSDQPGVGRAFNPSLDSMTDYIDSIGVAVEDQHFEGLHLVKVRLK